MLVPSPERNFARMPASHPDHLAVGEAALCAVYPDARNPFAHPELLGQEDLDAWSVPEVWIGGGPSPEHFLDVTEVFDRKLAALRAHVSQTAHMADLDDRLRGWGAMTARAGGLPDGRLAEAFQLVTIPI
jgi:LmbE family N-acetylglucosaminyl deacetylase